MESTESGFDLLLNDTFYVIFDILTPRPHFLILPHQKAKIKPDFKEMEPAQREKLMEAVLSILTIFKIRGSSNILSFHRGSWFSKASTLFHAHICVDVNLYLDLFEQRKEEIKTSPLWEKRGITPDQYPDEVRIYKRTYVKEEGERLPVPPRVIKWPVVDLGGTTNVLHLSHPKIGFVGKRNEIQPIIMLDVIEKFAQELGLTNWRSKDNIYGGCHVCLCLGIGKLIFDSISDKALYNFLYI